MKVKEISRQRRYFGPIHWGYQITLRLSPNEIQDLLDRLDEIVGRSNFRLKTGALGTYIKFVIENI